MKLRRGLINLALFVTLAALAGCAKLTLAWTDMRPEGDAAAPAVLGAFDGADPVADAGDWRETRAPALRAAFEAEVFGAFPDDYALTVLSRKILDEAAFNGAGRLIEYELQAEARFGDETRNTDIFTMDVVTPLGRNGAPIILMQTFCPRADTLPHPAVRRFEGAIDCSGGGLGGSIMTYVFGRYIATPPVEEILARGYAIATIFPSEFVPDEREAGLAALAALSPGLAPGEERWGAIAAWAWGFSLMADALAGDDDLAADEFIAWGHSRYGKSALVAAAWDERISGVIAHQSGTGGASLNHRKKGESVKAITASYPHWFARSYADYAGREEEMRVDQHQLLALIAPRPVLLGNARRDVWSDPNGAFRAALGADPAYELLGSEGLEQDRLGDWRPDADLAFWIRPGTHGVVKEDWPAFLEFLDAHFGGGERVTNALSD
jgi:hypothetical protein